MNIFEQFGLKEVANVTFYNIETGLPELFLDSLKVSTIEQTAENTEARGGWGNPSLITWDYNKEVNVTLEDALFSAASLRTIMGAGIEVASSAAKKVIDACSENKKEMIIGYVDDNDVSAYQKLVKLLKL